MRIILIRPRFAEGYRSPAVMEPLALAVLAALTPKEHEVCAIDERLDEKVLDRQADLVAITVCTFSAKRAYAIAAEYRKRGIPVVMGGFHPTLLPREALEHADAVVVGDAEASWPRVLADAAAGRLERLYAPASPGPCEAVQPDRSIFTGMKYLPIHLVQFGRGCPRSCEFCSVRAFYGGGVRRRPVAAVVDELRSCHGKRVLFVDDNMLSDHDALYGLLEAILPLKIRWSAQMELGISDDPKLLKLARRSGCQSLLIGFESLDKGNLRQMGKERNLPSDFENRIGRIRRAGIMVCGTFLFGYDNDEPISISRTLDFALKQKLCLANFNPLQPIPGTPLYERLSREGRLVYERWWLEPEYQWHEALLHPLGMTAEQLTEGCRRARERFHSLPGILRRLPSRANFNSVDNLAVYLAANLVSGLDIRAKSRKREPAP